MNSLVLGNFAHEPRARARSIDVTTGEHVLIYAITPERPFPFSTNGYPNRSLRGETTQWIAGNMTTAEVKVAGLSAVSSTLPGRWYL